MHLPPLPASSVNICMYAAFLARSLKYSSIPNYLNVIGLMHKEFGLPNPLLQNWHLSSLLTGIKRAKEHSPQQKLPISLDILRIIRRQLNFTCSVDASFWKICLVAFFGMFRKSHLVTKGTTTFDPSTQFVKEDFRFYPGGQPLR